MRARRPILTRPPLLRRSTPTRRPTLAALALGCAIAVAGCANTLQDQPVAPSILEPLVAQEQFPVYWLGGSFRGLGITHVTRDPSGAYAIQYGNCTVGGESACATPLQIVTSPDDSFLPGGETPQRHVFVRGAPAISMEGGETLAVATGAVVVDLYAESAALARAAAAAMVAINAPNAPTAPLPAPLRAGGYAKKPLASQQPPAAPVGWSAVVSLTTAPRRSRP